MTMSPTILPWPLTPSRSCIWSGQEWRRSITVAAPAESAGSAKAWLPPITVGSSARTNWESDVAVDAQDIPHIVYATRGDDPGVYYTRITDIEAIIDTPVRLSVGLEQPDEVAFACVSINIDSQGRMHALWSTVSTDGFGRAVYYARSVDGGQTWSPAFRLAQREPGSGFLELPSLGFVGDSELSVIYAYPSNMGRQERISLDAGETWGEPHTIYPDLEGIAGFNVQVNDAAGNLHVLSNMRTHDQVGGLFYWRWLDGNWSPWQLANTETETTGPGGHFTAATVRLGNEIHASLEHQPERPGRRSVAYVWDYPGRPRTDTCTPLRQRDSHPAADAS